MKRMLNDYMLYLDSLRRHKNINQKEMTARLGLCKATFYKKYYIKKVSKEDIARYADVLGLRVNLIFTQKKTNKKKTERMSEIRVAQGFKKGILYYSDDEVKDKECYKHYLLRCLQNDTINMRQLARLIVSYVKLRVSINVLKKDASS